jgi:hypothetical protein
MNGFVSEVTIFPVALSCPNSFAKDETTTFETRILGLDLEAKC